jgi:hypothetical protein
VPLPRTARWLLIALLLLGSVTSVAITYMVRATPMLRDRVVAALNQQFESQVELGALTVAAFPRPEISGSRLELRHNGRTDVPPLISIRDFTGAAGIAGLFGTPLRIRDITLNGLTIQVPPGGLSGRGSPDQGDPAPREGAPYGSNAAAPSLVIDRIEAAPVWLEIASRNQDKPPRIFDIHRLVMTNFSPDAPATFEASLTNAIPTGEIETEGTFGPYLARDPGQTPIIGRYTLQEAQLDDIKGLGGTLSSTGAYEGRLERLTVTGKTRSTNFAIDVSHQPVALNTEFEVIVDGTNGDTLLERVRATLINTVIDASGAVVRAREVKGRHVDLDVSISEGQLADVLTLAMKPGKPPIVGEIGVTAKLVIPAGEAPVIERMQLDGEFELRQARFTNFNVQKQVNTLSKRARGDEGDEAAESVVSDMTGAFTMRDGAIRFSALAFSVPGARVELAGSYGLKSEVMNFRGHLLMDASLADTTSGLKAIAARLVQPFFRREGGGSRIPIRVSGSRAKPSFGLDVRRAFLPG